MKIALLTNEYPPNVYGGAGVHVQYLVRELCAIRDAGLSMEVLCFGKQDIDDAPLRVHGIDGALACEPHELTHSSLIRTLIRETAMAGAVERADVVHCHTWYTHLAGCLLKQLLQAPLVLTTHSLEPHRPWKAEQLGAAYHASSWMERTAYQNADGVIAVSESMRTDVRRLYGVPDEKIRVIHNGIDLDEYRRQINPEVLDRYGIAPNKPYILFVGRITRQKGILHLVHALSSLRSDADVVLCAGTADTPDLESEMTLKVEEARRRGGRKVVWIPQIVPKPDLISIYSAAALFVCPSIYEPFGIINLEAMACGIPVVGSALGGIPEIVAQGETGLLVPFEPAGGANLEPADPGRFSRDLASAIDSLLGNPARLEQMGRNARERVEKLFSWQTIARQTLAFYRELTKPE